jgi:hypothetical protein
MGAHQHENVVIEEKYVLGDPARKRIFGAIGLGVILFIIGVVLLAMGVGQHHEAEQHSERIEYNTKPAATEAGEDGSAASQIGDPMPNGGSYAAPHERNVAQYGNEGYKSDVPYEGAHHFSWIKRIYANLWLNAVFFAGIAIIGVFFVAIQYVAHAGWSANLIRVPMAFGSFLPWAFGAMFIVFLASYLTHDSLFHWTHSNLYNEFLEDGVTRNPDYDEIIAGKKGFLNIPFYLIRMVVFFAIWYVMFNLIKKASLREDLDGGVNFYKNNIKYSAIFLVFFAVTSSIAAWDWVMSIDPHWFSTLFGWYVFSSWWVSGLAVITLAVVLLKEKGYLSIVNHNHLHDLGKFMFAFSIFWTYLWFSQFLLIYYANIPEETIYFVERLRGYNGQYTALVFINLFLNFFFPFLVLMTRDAKRQMIFLKIAASVIIVGHWLDFYLMIMPGTVGIFGGFGFVEFGTVLTFAGVFIYVVSKALAKAPLIAKNHPMLQESIHHDI